MRGACYTNRTFVDDDGRAARDAPKPRVTSDCSQMLSGVVLNVQGLKMATGEPDVPPLQGRARFRELLLGDQPCQSEDSLEFGSACDSVGAVDAELGV
ncbi:potassium channel subfamily T member 2 [Tachysurus ichikawai]